MKTKLFTMLAAIAALGAFASGCDKPDETPSCLIGRGFWIAKYTPATGPNDADTADCVGTREGDIYDINKYQAFPVQGQPAPIASIAIRPFVYNNNNLAATDKPTSTTAAADRHELAQGNFASNDAAADNTCSVPVMTTASVTTVKNYGGTQAEADVKGISSAFIFSNVQFFDDRKHPGQQMQADLEFHRGTCVQSYKVLAMAGTNIYTGGPQPCFTQADCDPRINQDPNRIDIQLGLSPLASGINPDYPVSCDDALGVYVGWGAYNYGADTGVCFLDGPFKTSCDSSSDPNCWKSGPNASGATP